MISKGKNRFLKWEKPILVPRFGGIESIVRQEQKAAQEDPSKIDFDKVVEALDGMFPVKHMQRDNKQWCQRVSRERSTTHDIRSLADVLDSVIEEHEKDGTSRHVKPDIYKECMVELVRQEIVECPQRGLLLRKTTDVIFGMMDSLSKLCASAFSYGMVKALQANRAHLQLQEQLQKLKDEQNVIKAKLEELEESLLTHQNQLEKEVQKQTEDFMVEEEILEESNELLEKQLEVLVDPRTAEGNNIKHLSIS